MKIKRYNTRDDTFVIYDLSFRLTHRKEDDVNGKVGDGGSGRSGTRRRKKERKRKRKKER